jgi:uncharacterized membrane protein
MISATIAIHLVAALPAFGIGAFMLARPKGTPVHKVLGRIWIILIVVVSISSIWIQEIRDGAGYSFIHLLSVWTLFAVTMGFVAVRRGQVRRHRGWMIGTFIGLVVAGLFTLAPGRIIPTYLFG